MSADVIEFPGGINRARHRIAAIETDIAELDRVTQLLVEERTHLLEVLGDDDTGTVVPATVHPPQLWETS